MLYSIRVLGGESLRVGSDRPRHKVLTPKEGNYPRGQWGFGVASGLVKGRQQAAGVSVGVGFQGDKGKSVLA